MIVDWIAYADESGTHGNSIYCLICGYIGSQRQWKLFERSWAQVLEENQVPDFHAKDFFARDSQGIGKNHYHGWSQKQAMRFLDTLTDVINQRQLYPVGAAVEVKEFNSFSVGERRFLTVGKITPSGKWLMTGAPYRPYQLAYIGLLTDAVKKIPLDTRMHFVMDSNKVEEPLARLVFNDLVKGQYHPEWAKLGDVTYASRTTRLGLQAADLQAHVWYNYLEKRNEMDSERQRAIEALTERHDGIKLLDRVGMELLLSQLSSEQRDRLRAEVA